MPSYNPIAIGIPLQASRSDLVSFDWRSGGIKADFSLPSEPDYLLQIAFEGQCIVRILDEMALSTESDGPAIGLVSENFAYVMSGSVFELGQSEAWKSMNAPVKHYRFITGWGCMDVLSAAEPAFQRVSAQSR